MGIFDRYIGQMRARMKLKFSLRYKGNLQREIIHSKGKLKHEIYELRQKAIELTQDERRGDEMEALRDMINYMEKLDQELDILQRDVNDVQILQKRLEDTYGKVSQKIQELRKKHPEIAKQAEESIKRVDQMIQRIRERYEKARTELRDLTLDHNRMREFSWSLSSALIRSIKREAKDARRNDPTKAAKRLESILSKLDHVNSHTSKEELQRMVNEFQKEIQENENELSRELDDLYAIEHSCIILEMRLKNDGLTYIKQDIEKFAKEGMLPEVLTRINQEFAKLQKNLDEKDKALWFSQRVLTKAA